MSYTIGQMCERCGFESPRAKVCGECEMYERGETVGRAEGAAAERARLVAVVRAMLETEALMSRGALRRVLEAMGATEEGSEA